MHDHPWVRQGTRDPRALVRKASSTKQLLPPGWNKQDQQLWGSLAVLKPESVHTMEFADGQTLAR